MVATEVRKVATETGGRLVVAKVNTEDVPTLGYRCHVSTIRTMILFQNGIEVARQASAMPASQIRQLIEQHT
jgi:thioredoxin-like negative regulator of GroEL